MRTKEAGGGEACAQRTLRPGSVDVARFDLDLSQYSARAGRETEPEQPLAVNVNRSVTEQVVELAAQFRQCGGGDLTVGRASVDVQGDEATLTVQLSGERVDAVPGV